MLPEDVLARVAEDAGRAKNDNLVDSMLLDSMRDLRASTTPVD